MGDLETAAVQGLPVCLAPVYIVSGQVVDCYFSRSTLPSARLANVQNSADGYESFSLKDGVQKCCFHHL